VSDARNILETLQQRGVTVWAEGSRLRFRAAKGALTDELRSQLSAQKDGVLAAWREQAAQQVAVHPATHGQRALWFLHQTMPQSSSYNVLFSARICSKVDLAALRHACQAMIDRHPALRTTFAIEGDDLVQKIHGHAELDWRVHDRPNAGLGELEKEVIQHSRVPFDLAQGSLLRIELFSRAPDDHILLIAVHHIAADGWSTFLLLDELRQLYPAECQEGALPKPRPANDVVAFAPWQHEMLAGPVGQAHARYWSEALSGEIPVLDLPTDRRRPATFSDAGSSVALELGADLSAAVRTLAAASNTTPYVVLLAAFHVLLHRYSGQSVVIVGSPTYGRDRPEFADVVGDFINMIPLKGDFTADPTFADFLAGMRRRVLDGIEHQDYPFPLLVEQLQPQRDPSRTPIFQTIFVLQKFTQLAGLESILSGNASGVRSDFGGLMLEAFSIPQQEGQIDLSLELLELGGTYKGQLKYKTDLFDSTTVAALVRHYVTLLGACVRAPQTAVSRLPILEAEERQELIDGFNRSPALTARNGIPVEGNATLHALFEAAALRHPAAIAVSCNGEHLTYRQLNARANRLARRLQSLGVGPDVLVGICLERSSDLIVGLLGILKAGGAYLPIDLAYPADRLAFMLEDAHAPVLLTQSHLIGQLPQTAAKVIEIDGLLREVATVDDDLNPTVAVAPDHLAYVIYTSGTTGKPKGSLITHRNVVRLFSATDHWYGFNDRDVWTLFHSYAFDFSVWEIWGALLYGGRLVVVPYLVSRSPAAFYELLATEQVTVLNQTPSAFRQLMVAEETSGQRPLALRYVIFGGEALEMSTLRPWFERHGDRQPQLVNMYGITETTVHVTYRPVGSADLSGGSVIGIPIPDLQVYILDARGEPVPVGVAGEMYVGGAGLARGYLYRPELTAERFVPDHLKGPPGGRLYRSGDLVRFLPGRDIEYLGRIDQQVKIRGFRIELGEIESVLCQHPQVREATVLALGQAGDEKRLVAYVVPQGAAPAVGDLREHLKKKVPDYMVPAAFVLLEKLPLTNNGKIDRKALPKPGAADTGVTEKFEPAATETERVVSQVFAEVLGVSSFGVQHNFFELGGHSLLATGALARLRDHFKVAIPVNVFFQSPTPRGLSRWLDAATGNGSSASPTTGSAAEEPRRWKCLVSTQPAGSRAPLFLVTGYMDADDTLRILSNLIPHLGADQPLCGLRPRWLDGQSPGYRSVEELADEYLADLRAFQPAGPYYLLGDCVGGVVAVEMALKLKAQGDEVALLVLLDTERPRYHSFLLTEIARLWNRGKHVMEVLKQVWRPTTGTRRQAIAEVFQRKLRRARLSDQPITATDHIHEQRMAYQRLLKRHRLKRYPGHIVLILTAEVYRFAWLLGWNGFAAGGVELHLTPGDHETFRALYSRELGQRLRQCIDQAQARVLGGKTAAGAGASAKAAQNRGS